MTDLDSPGGRLRLARARRGLTQADLAWMVGVTQPAVAHWESDRTTPSAALQQQVADALDTSRLFLFGDSSDRHAFRHLIEAHWPEVLAIATALHSGALDRAQLLEALDGEPEALTALLVDV